MKPTTRMNLNNGWPRFLGFCLVAAMSLLAGGCAMTMVEMAGDPSIVSEARAKRDLGIDYLSGRKTAMAIRQLTASLELDSTDPQTHLWLGEAYRRKGQAEKAEGLFLEALAISGANGDEQSEHEALLSLSGLLSQMGRYEDSLQYCETLSADAMFATPWRPLSNCGWALMQLDRNAEARDHFKEALDFFPHYPPALLNLGILEAEEGHRMAAISLLDRALDSGRLNASGHAESNFRLGEIYVALGHREKAVEHFSAAAKIAPEMDWGSQSQAYLDLLR